MLLQEEGTRKGDWDWMSHIQNVLKPILCLTDDITWEHKRLLCKVNSQDTAAASLQRHRDLFQPGHTFGFPGLCGLHQAETTSLPLG